MIWTIKCQMQDGRVMDTGEWQTSIQAAKEVAKDMAWEMPFTTFFVEGPNRRVPAVYHFWVLF